MNFTANRGVVQAQKAMARTTAAAGRVLCLYHYPVIPEGSLNCREGWGDGRFGVRRTVSAAAVAPGTSTGTACQTLRSTFSALAQWLQCPDGIFAALAVHMAHKARGLAVDWRPNTVYAPLSVADLDLQVGCLTSARCDLGVRSRSA